MADILQEIVAHKRVELEQQKALVPPRELYAVPRPLVRYV